MTPISMDNSHFFPQYHCDLSNTSVEQLLLQYKDNPVLLSHILIAKTEEDKKRTAEELRLAEEARLKVKYLEYELSQYGQFTQPYNSNLNSSTPFIDPLRTGVEFPQVNYTPHPVTRPHKVQKHRRTLSYESVLTLKNTEASPPSTPKVLNHEKVMEALRAKLRRSTSSTSSAFSGYKKSSPELPNTYPTTGVLLLNLRNRQNKLSISRRKS